MSTKVKAVLVYSSFVSRVIVPENATQEQIIEAAQDDLHDRIYTEGFSSHVEKIEDDTEYPIQASLATPRSVDGECIYIGDDWIEVTEPVPYKWENDTFYVMISGNWKEAQSIDFDFN